MKQTSNLMEIKVLHLMKYNSRTNINTLKKLLKQQSFETKRRNKIS